MDPIIDDGEEACGGSGDEQAEGLDEAEIVRGGEEDMDSDEEEEDDAPALLRQQQDHDALALLREQQEFIDDMTEVIASIGQPTTSDDDIWITFDHIIAMAFKPELFELCQRGLESLGAANNELPMFSLMDGGDIQENINLFPVAVTPDDIMATISALAAEIERTRAFRTVQFEFGSGCLPLAAEFMARCRIIEQLSMQREFGALATRNYLPTLRRSLQQYPTLRQVVLGGFDEDALDMICHVASTMPLLADLVLEGLEEIVRPSMNAEALQQLFLAPALVKLSLKFLDLPTHREMIVLCEGIVRLTSFVFTDISFPLALIDLFVQTIATSRLKSFQYAPTTGANLLEPLGFALPDSGTLQVLTLGSDARVRVDVSTQRVIGRLHGDVVATFLQQRPRDLRIRTLKIYLQVWSGELENALVQYLKVNPFVRSIEFVVGAEYDGPAEASMDIAVAIGSSSCCLQDITFVGCERTNNWHRPLEHYRTLSRFRLSHGARFAAIGQSEDGLVNRQRLVFALETLDPTSLFMFLVRNEWDLATPIIPLYRRG